MTSECGRWLIVADDITGAAEVAGAASAMGHRVRIVRGGADTRDVGTGSLVVLDTDSRPLPPAAAAAQVEQLVRPWLASGRRLAFKKTDSVLRGSVAAELCACLDAGGYASTVLIPANPSRGRTIQAGKLYVGGVLLHETEFARDPEHPATTSDVHDLLAINRRQHAHLASPCERSAARIVTADATSADNLARWATALRPDQLPAGGVEFFRAWLEQFVPTIKPQPASSHVVLETPLLAVCGSRSIAGRLARDELLRCGGTVLRAPHDLTAARLKSRRCGRWAKNASDAIEVDRMVVLETGRVQAEPAIVRDAVARCVAQILESVRVNALLIEGGSTASSILTRMGWHSFDVVGQIEPGTVALRAGKRLPLLVLKPGTYRWPGGLLEAIERTLGSDTDPAARPPSSRPSASHSSVSR